MTDRTTIPASCDCHHDFGLHDRVRALEAELNKSRDNHAEAFRVGAEAMRERDALKAEVEQLKRLMSAYEDEAYAAETGD